KALRSRYLPPASCDSSRGRSRVFTSLRISSWSWPAASEAPRKALRRRAIARPELPGVLRTGVQKASTRAARMRTLGGVKDQPWLKLLDMLQKRLGARDARIEIGGRDPD